MTTTSGANAPHVIPNPRWWLIELLAWWEGAINTTRLTHSFGIGRQQASKDINTYHASFPQQLWYDSRSKCYRPAQTFQPVIISGDVDEYLNHIHGWQQLPTHTNLPMEALPVAKRTIPVDVIRPLVSALRQQQRLEVEYLSVSNPEPHGRVIVPTHFVKTGLRWHLRAWCEKSSDYRDFVLSRFRGNPELSGPPIAPLPADERWNTLVEIVLKPDPRLQPLQQEVVCVDYGMNNGELRIPTRAALAHYLLRDMQVNYKMLDGNAAAQQLVLANLNEIRQWLP